MSSSLVRTDRGVGGNPWWLSPTVIVVLIVSAAALPSLVLSDETFRTEWRTPKMITAEIALLFLTGGAVLGLAALLAASLISDRREERGSMWPVLTPSQAVVLGKAGAVTFWLTVVGYVALIGAAAKSGVTLTELQTTLASGDLQGGSVKSKLELIPGVTSLTQVGVAAAILAAIQADRGAGRRQLLRLAVLFGMAIPRAYLLTERLALLELAFPVLVVIAMRLSAGSARGRRAVRWMPAIAVPAVIAIFAMFEYSRSWVFYRTYRGGSFVDFAFTRIVGYYVTALNNGYIDLTFTRQPGQWPGGTLAFLWSAPGLAEFNLLNRLDGYNVSILSTSNLLRFGNPEFNNPGGIATPFVDYGWLGGLVYLALAGVVVGLLYRQFLNGGGIGMLLYPIFFLGLLELPRYLYWAQGRALPSVVALAIVAVLLRRAARRDEGFPRLTIARTKVLS